MGPLLGMRSAGTDLIFVIQVSIGPLREEGSNATELDLSEPHEVKYGTQKFGVSLDQLKAAVAKVGDSATAVAQSLGKLL